MVEKYIVEFAVVALLVASAEALNNPACGSNKFTVDSCRGDGFSVESSDNIRGFYVNVDNGLRLYTVVEDHGFVVNGVDKRGTKLSVNVKNLEKGQVKFNTLDQDHNGMCNFKNLPDGYQVSPGIGAHKLFTTPTQWNSARNICKNDGGHLTVINSRSEETILLNMIKKAGVEDVLLGVHDLFTDSQCRDWVTVEDVSLKDTGYEVWSPLINPNPDNWKGKQHCLRLLKTGGMDDIECFSNRPYICEISCSDWPVDTFKPQISAVPSV